MRRPSSSNGANVSLKSVQLALGPAVRDIARRDHVIDARTPQRGAQHGGIGVGLRAATDVQVRDVGESRGISATFNLHALSNLRYRLNSVPLNSGLCPQDNITATTRSAPHRYLIGKYPTFVTIAWPSGDSTQSVNALISAVGLARV